MLIEKGLPVLGAAMAIAAAVAFIVAPRFAETPTPATPTVSAAVVAVDKTNDSKISNAAFIDRKNDGHYWTTADVDGTAVKFMVDTGASIVALTTRDAKRIGFDTDTLEFVEPISTAGGTVYGAYVTVDSIRIGRVEVERVDAMILPEGLENSLLGMTFLGELYSYEFRKSQLIIRQ